MIALEVRMDLRVTSVGMDSMPLDEELNRVMEELVRLSATDCGIDDPALSHDANLGMVTVEVTVTAEDFDKAVETADACIRTAIHAAGGHTPGWNLEKRSQHAELVGA
jgi:hypothetical protein